MTEIYIVYAAVAFLGLLSLVAGLFNWIRLTVTAHKIAALEAEIEKKAHEFDSIRRERATRTASEPLAAPEDELTENAATEDMGSGIEIYRNVRGHISRSAEPYYHQPQSEPDRQDLTEHGAAPLPSDPHPAAMNAAPDIARKPCPDAQSAPANPGYSAPAPWDSHMPTHESEPGDFDPGEGADVMDVVEDQPKPATPEPLDENNSDAVTVALYSDRLKDVDFERTLGRLHQALAHMRNPFVTLDFTNVLFLYEKEQQALERLAANLDSVGGNMQFVNCQPELIAILRSSRLLARYVRTA